MLSAHKFIIELLGEFQKLALFASYWPEDLEAKIPDVMKKARVPQGYSGFFQNKIFAKLRVMAHAELLAETQAELCLSFTSSDPIVAYERFLSNDPMCGVNAIVIVKDSGGREVVRMQKLLWNEENAQVSGDERYIGAYLREFDGWILKGSPVDQDFAGASRNTAGRDIQ